MKCTGAENAGPARFAPVTSIPGSLKKMDESDYAKLNEYKKDEEVSKELFLPENAESWIHPHAVVRIRLDLPLGTRSGITVIARKP